MTFLASRATWKERPSASSRMQLPGPSSPTSPNSGTSLKRTSATGASPELGGCSMPKLSIDSREVSVPEGTTVIQAAENLGIFIPRYCYHPGLSIAGNCRICLVDVEKVPKLQIACNTPVTEGMVVHTRSDKAEDGRRAVLEFLLANHPLDCPVCDQSGECDLQTFYLDCFAYD